MGEKPLETALKQYQTVRTSAEANLNQFQAQLQTPGDANETNLAVPTEPSAAPVDMSRLSTSIQQQQELVNQLDLRIGILQAEQGNTAEAQTAWNGILDRPTLLPTGKDLTRTAEVLVGLWSEPPRLLPDAEPVLKQLDGWFRYRSLTRLYELQQRSDRLAALQATERQVAQRTIVKLALVNVIPVIGGTIGLILLIGTAVRQLFRKDTPKVDAAGVTTAETSLSWSVPWEWDTTLQVIVLGFFFVGQIILPFFLQIVGLNFAALGNQAKAAYTLTYYLLMAGGGLTVLYLSIRPFFPLPEDWFQIQGKRNWFLWGLGGYLAALPLMVGVSIINQQIWQGQGGSNPLLQTVLEEGDRVAISLFFFTAAVAAPVFEEILFRGFLLPSLTRYVPVWSAIGLSALLFALAHLSLSEVLPLAVLGMVLGYVYTRSRGLLAPILLHSLWNSATMVGLLVLGSGSR
ncbi:CPBP family intramembrane glutamic endopeptidase [Egbenema bharatensis]|uniref:CPBP family intramembrane glutamic endopeptidase n=1 Tax=Egbenema bharatensis TaxID=3463334 RepID=UPI003A866D7B